MQLTRLGLEGFGSFASRCELDLAGVDVCAVTGPNGAGKSTLFDAVIWCLLGTVPGRPAATVINETGSRADVEVCLRDQAGEHRIRRARGVSGSVQAEYESPSGDAITGAKPVTARMSDLLGCDADLLALTAFARQGQAGMFGAMTPSDRRNALSKVLLDNLYDEPQQVVAERRSGARDRANRLDERRLQAEEAAADAEDAQAEHAAAVLAAEETGRLYSDAQQAARAAAAASARLQAAEDAHAAHDRLARRVQSSARQAASLRAAAEDAARKMEQAEADKLDDRAIASAQKVLRAAEKAAEKAAESLSDAKSSLSEARAVSEGAEERIALLEREGAECPVCEAPLSDEKADLLITDLRERIEDTAQAQEDAARAADSARRARGAEAHAREGVDSARDDLERKRRLLIRLRAEAEAAVEKAQMAETEAADLDAEAEMSRGALPDLAALRAEAGDMPDTQSLQRSHEDAQQRLGEAEARLRVARDAELALPAARDASEEAAGKVLGLDLLNRALAPTGVPHLALSRWAAHLAAQANEALETLGGLKIRLVVSDAAKAKPPLGLEARSPSSPEWRSYDTFSGGERMRLDIAMRVGLTQTCGIQCRTMVLDEGWGALDPPSASALARLLAGLVVSGRLASFYTITHIAAAADEFRHRIEVSKTIAGSTARLVSA